ncbi:MAG: S46 family peptidase, partial [Bacteroidales bacterium]|nr:S46 family peptidase [Bacteroidales bacterium]
NSDNKPAKFSKDNQPYKPKHFLPINIKGVKKNDFAMIWGFPGSTERYMTSGEVANTINVVNPSIVRAGEYMLPTMNKMMEKDNRVNLIYASDYAGYMNLWKNKKGELRGLKKLDVYSKKKAIEDRLTSWIESDKSRIEKYGPVVEDLKKANNEIANANGTKYLWYGNLGLMSNKRALIAFQHSMSLMTMDKKDKNYERVVGILKQKGTEHFETYDQETEKELFKSLVTMFSNIDKDNFISKTLEKKFKGNIDAFVEKAFKESVFGNQSNYEKFMKNPKPKKLGKDLIAQSALTAYSYIGVGDETLVKAEENLSNARIRFVAALREMDPSLVQYPDANFTMRMTYGKVLDYYPADGVHYDYVTTLAGVMEKEDETSSEFQVPAKLKELYLNKDYGQYANEKGEIITCFLSNNDITGGNSGSPILNAEGHLIGLAFDGNWEAMSGDIAFEPEVQRTINVDARYVLFIIDKFAGAKNLIDELTIIK